MNVTLASYNNTYTNIKKMVFVGTGPCICTLALLSTTTQKDNPAKKIKTLVDQKTMLSFEAKLNKYNNENKKNNNYENTGELTQPCKSVDEVKTPYKTEVKQGENTNEKQSNIEL